MPRHRRVQSGWYRRRAVVAGVTTVALLGAGWVGYRQFAAEPCTGRADLAVAAPPDFAPAVQAAAAGWAAATPAVAGICVTVTVTEATASDVAAAVAAQHDVNLIGLGGAGRATAVPDVWIPDSSAWVARLAALAPGFRPTDGGSVARNPVVLAAPEPVAASLNWLNAKLGWTDVLQQIAAGGAVRVGMVEPTRDATSLSGLLALGAAAASRPDGANVTTAALRSVAAGGSAVRADLLAKFPRGADAAQLAAGLAAAVLSEADVIRFNAGKPPVRLAALYPEPAPAAMDYPYAVLPGASPVQVAAAAGLRRALAGPGFRDALARLGLRAPDGSFGTGFAAPAGAPAGPDPAAPAAGAGPGPGALDLAAVDRLLATWTVVTGPARMLAVIDVSGTMLRPVPTAGGVTRIDLTVATAQQGLELLDDTWSLGLWVFSAKLDGEKDHREVVPIGLLSTRRPQLISALAQIRAVRSGNTGLFDTVLAAYQTVQDDWVAGQANSVVLFTDGAGNDDPEGGLSEAELVDRLGKVADPRRPVQMVLIGIGDEVDQGELKRIAAATGGSAFVAEDPAKIGEIFLKAVALRPVTPR